jgi:hypothetical protein
VFTGVSPARHRVVANGEYTNRDGSHRTFAARAFDAGRRVVVSSAWPEITSNIVEPDVALERAFNFDATGATCESAGSAYAVGVPAIAIAAPTPSAAASGPRRPMKDPAPMAAPEVSHPDSTTAGPRRGPAVRQH